MFFVKKRTGEYSVSDLSVLAEVSRCIDHVEAFSVEMFSILVLES